MLLTRRSSSVDATATPSMLASLQRGVSRALPTVDRRGFLRRSGLGLGAGLALPQLTMIRKAEAADGAKASAAEGARKIEVKRTL